MLLPAVVELAAGVARSLGEAAMSLGKGLSAAMGTGGSPAPVALPDQVSGNVSTALHHCNSYDAACAILKLLAWV
jgi:hypothetical protein